MLTEIGPIEIEVPEYAGAKFGLVVHIIFKKPRWLGRLHRRMRRS
jgi:hypothetical protein